LRLVRALTCAGGRDRPPSGYLSRGGRGGDPRRRAHPHLAESRPSYLLDFTHAGCCAKEAERVAAQLADAGHDTFPWDPSFDRPLCVRTGRVCFQRPVRRAVHVTLDVRRFPDHQPDDEDRRARLPLPVAYSACSGRQGEGAAFSVFFDAAGEFSTTIYDVTLTCDGGRWTARAERFYIVY
jgi:hypothetical protein